MSLDRLTIALCFPNNYKQFNPLTGFPSKLQQRQKKPVFYDQLLSPPNVSTFRQRIQQTENLILGQNV